MKMVDLMDVCYKIRCEAIRESEKIERLRAIAKEQVMEEKKPFVVFHWSESSKIKMGVESFKKANSTIYNLNWCARQEGSLGYYKTKLDIYFYDGKEVCGYECLRYDIGSDEKDLIRHIESYKNHSVLLSNDEKDFMAKAINILAKAV